MRVKPLPPTDILRQLLECDPETGSLRWLPRSTDWFEGAQSARVCKVWNSRYAGHEAFLQRGRDGYLRGKFLGDTILTHRLIWKLITGEEPEFIDHINGDKTDNRISNLRSVSWGENAKNRPRPSNNKSGVVGVHWCNVHQWWTVQISRAGKQRQIGWFRNKADAIACRLDAEKRHGFHRNHGR